MTQATLDRANMMGCMLSRCVMEQVSAVNVNFHDPSQSSVCLMEGANCRGAVFEDSNMSCVNMRVACLKNANLSNCNLRCANLAGQPVDFFLKKKGWERENQDKQQT